MPLHFTIRDLLWLTLTLTMSTVGSGFGPGALDFNYALTGGYRLYRNSSHQIMIAPKGGWTADTPIVRPKVVEVAWDDRFILAKRQVLKFRDEFSGDKYELPDPGKFDYWILDTNDPKLFGPLDGPSFVAKRKELNVSPDLVLKDVYNFAP